MPFTPCEKCPRPDWCSAGTPRCEIEEAAGGLEATAQTSSEATAQTSGPSEAKAGSSPEAPLEVVIRWPNPAELAPISLAVGATAARVWSYIAPDEDHAAAALRHDTIAGAASDAFRLIQERIEVISSPGKVSHQGLFCAVSALIAMYLATQWIQNSPRDAEHAAHITGVFSAYAHAIAVEMMCDLQDRGLIDPLPSIPEKTEAEKIADAFRNG